ncbi:MAG: SIR2 family NAD-dependent protein deacylase [Dokdonella sp.]|uniref:SIR2 family NAD-dependent protein deacylase n=1 Tax=Dokdonella sp. TaxID=2291710 RepID=UPI003F81E2DB
MSDAVVDGAKFEYLESLLSSYDANKIRCLARLPTDACLTTNFDRSIFDAYALEKNLSPREYSYADSVFKRAAWDNNLFVARIHGAIEAAETCVLTTRQFDEIVLNEHYVNVLRQYFVRENIVFLGFSFYDPAIQSVIREFQKSFGPAAPGRHLAILPRGSASDLIIDAAKLNIKVVEYDSADDHKEFWDALNSYKPKLLSGSSSFSRTFGLTRFYLAACYARANLNTTRTALRQSVLEGFVSAHLQSAHPAALSVDEIAEKIRRNIGIGTSEVSGLVSESLSALRRDGLCKKVESDSAPEKFEWIGELVDIDSPMNAVARLANGIVHRASIQENWKIDPTLTPTIHGVVQHMILRRGWDLGAAFAMGRPPEEVAIQSLVDQSATTLPAFDRERLTRILTLMLRNPTQDESKALGELGRMSFALEMAFHSPKSILLHEAVLPRGAYVDSSILLPAIVFGHPYHGVYHDTFQKLREAATNATFDFSLMVTRPYLNEVISHKNLAIAYHREAGSKFLDVLSNDVAYHGAANVNVFLGSYAILQERDPSLNFGEFLASYAPYKTEDNLRGWLENNHFKVVETSKNNRYAKMYGQLEVAYANKLERGKQPILIEHDALQIARLEDDILRGRRYLLVTADKNLHKKLSDSEFDVVRDSLLSHVALVQLVDLLIGGISESAGATDLMWSTRISTRTQSIAAFLTSKSLSRYDAATAMCMPTLVEQFSDKVVEELGDQGADLESDDALKRTRAFQQLGVLADRYFERMSLEIDKINNKINN